MHQRLARFAVSLAARALAIAPCVRECTGVQFDGVEAGTGGGLGLLRFRCDERARQDSRILEWRQKRLPVIHSAGDSQPAFGGHFLPPLRDKRDLIDPVPQRDRLHLRGSGHFEVEFDVAGVADQVNVPIDHVAAVFAQMERDAIRAAAYRRGRGRHDIGLPVAHAAARPAAIAGLAEGRDMIDVDSEQRHRPIVGPLLRRVSLPT